MKGVIATVGVTLALPPKPIIIFFRFNRPVITAKKTITTTRPSTKETILLKLSISQLYNIIIG